MYRHKESTGCAVKTAISAQWALLPGGWASDVRVEIDAEGRIAGVATGAAPGVGDQRVPFLLPAVSNLHSHTFQRAMAGLAERRGPSGRDSFWTWRAVMYRFLDILTPDEIEAIAAVLERCARALAQADARAHAVDGPPDHDRKPSSEPGRPQIASTATQGVAPIVADSSVAAALLDRLTALMGGPQPEMFRELVQVYLEDGRAHLTAMPPALARGDASELRRRLHALKGSSRNLGVPIIADACQALEARLLDGDLQAIAPDLEALDRDFGALGLELGRAFLTP